MALFPLTTIDNGSTEIVIPEDRHTSERNFEVTFVGSNFQIVESEYKKTHRLKKASVDKLEAFGFESDEICELMVSLQECLSARNIAKSDSELVDIIEGILNEVPSPTVVFNNFHNMDIDEVVYIVKDIKSSLYRYKEITCYHDSDDYSDGNRVKY